MSGVELQIVHALTGLLALTVSVGVAYVGKYVKAHFHSQAFDSAVGALGKIANATVADFNQRVVNSAKAGGVFTQAMADKVKQDAVAAVKQQGSPLLKVVSKDVSSVNGLISSLIEQSVVANKSSQSSSAPAPADTHPSASA